ncbi:hypothetical protein [Mycolicibacterium setense]|uniref:hypothetical protein n=1 Tax=Mycolicibacterium setense TaxID=431269 RepID=UPI000AF3BE20|nr:hypothetical protein [Mycolicibacterium setense]
MVGAGVIAVTPVTAPPPEIHTQAVQLSATAIDNPIDVFGPVVEKVDTLVQQAIQSQLDNPFPVVNGLIGKVSADGQHLGAIATVVGQQVFTVAANFPVAMGKAAQRAATGDFTGAVGEFTPVFTGPMFQILGQWPLVPAYVRQQFVVVGQLVSEVMGVSWSITMGQALRVFTVVNAVAGALDELADAIPAGDPGRAVNAVQHGIANTASAVLNIAGGVRVHLDRSRGRIRDILNPPPPATDAPVGTAAVAGATTLSLPVAPAQESAGEAPAVAGASESEVTTTESVTTAPRTNKPLVRDSLMATPGKGGLKNGASGPTAKLVSEVSEKISATVDKIDRDVKKAFAKPEKKASAAESDGGSAGSAGASGDTD